MAGQHVDPLQPYGTNQPAQPASGIAAPTTDPRFGTKHYLIKRKFLALFGASFRIFGSDPNTPVFFCRQKAFKLKEDIRVYGDETKTEEILLIQADRMIDFSASYSIVDSKSGERIGGMRRKGWSSFVRDAWQILNPSGQQIAELKEDSMGLALLRRFIAGQWLPQKFMVTSMQGAPLGMLKQRFNPFLQCLEVNFAEDKQGVIDPRMMVAIGVLICAIEGRQQG